jgi:NADH dehydrogenase
LGESVYAIGDNAAVDGMPLPTNAQVAMQQADVAAYNIWRAPQNDRKPASYVYFSLGEALSLGPTNASISSVGPVKVAGVLGTLARRGLYVVRQPTGRQRLRAAREAFRSLARVAVGGDSRAARLTRTSADAAGQSSQP